MPETIEPTETAEPLETEEFEESEADLRREAILRCTRGALSNAQKALEEQYLDLRKVINNYMGGYCRYLPEICDYESARDFIACVIYGMGIEAIAVERGTKLLYGAQVAVIAFRPSRGK